LTIWPHRLPKEPRDGGGVGARAAGVGALDLLRDTVSGQKQSQERIDERLTKLEERVVALEKSLAEIAVRLRTADPVELLKTVTRSEEQLRELKARADKSDDRWFAVTVC
jgi:uncharacterized coiled-coil protein SlyX